VARKTRERKGREENERERGGAEKREGPSDKETEPSDRETQNNRDDEGKESTAKPRGVRGPRA